MPFDLYFMAKDGTKLLLHKGIREIQLPVETPIHLEAVSFGIVRHRLWIEIHEKSRIMTFRAPGILGNYHVLVDQGPIIEGEVVTTLFNLSNKPVRIAKGEIVSWLIEL